MMLGVPIVPCILVMAAFFVMAIWTLVFAGFVAAASVLLALLFAMLTLRYMTSQDDQRLHQYLMYLRTCRLKRNARWWGAHSMSPLNIRQRRTR